MSNTLISLIHSNKNSAQRIVDMLTGDMITRDLINDDERQQFEDAIGEDYEYMELHELTEATGIKIAASVLFDELVDCYTTEYGLYNELHMVELMQDALV